ncbi:MAG: hypothetical protein HC803_05075, partial [Saprospiraceae bacterium]|nr:hypothetical protein [Saprospiraceae bacterium]
MWISNGTITITAAGGTAPLQYSIDGGVTFQASNTFTGLAGGTYNVIVTNANGSCPVTYPTVTLVAPVAPVISAVVGTNPSDCGVFNGAIQITASGTGALQYSINGGMTWQQGDMFSGLPGGTYNISVRNINGTCVVTYPAVTLTAPVLPVINNVVSANPTGCGTNDGTITVTATGASIEYSINGGFTWQATGNFTGLNSGTYFIAVRNTDGTCSVMYNNNPVIITAPNSASITDVQHTQPTNCGVDDGTITIVANGGTAPLQYSIDGGLNFQASNTFTGLGGGTYQTVVRNSDNSCPVNGQSVTLIDRTPATIANVSSTNPTDCGLTDGTITITAAGVGSLEYSIDGGNNWQAANIFLNVPAGFYTIAVRNIDGTCEVIGSTVIITAPFPAVITGVVFTDPSNCGVNDGTITVTASSGPNTEYSIDGGINWQTSPNFTGLGAGVFNVFVRNNDGSCLFASANNPIILTAPNGPTITNVASTNPTDCNFSDGSITITANGAGGLQYSIDGGTTWQLTNTFTGLAGGSYQITVANDDTTCLTTGPVRVIEDKVAPVISLVTTSNPTDCGVVDGTISIFAAGSGALQYSINGGTSWSQTNQFSNLPAGTYAVIVRNIDGTCDVAYGNVTLTAPELPTITTVVAADPSNCGVNNGTITVTATGTSIEYSIDGGITWFSNGGNFTGLASGTYNVAVRNTDGTCEVLYINNSIVLNAPNAPSITSVTQTNPTNCGVTDGTITITAQGGIATLEYSIDGGTTWFANNGNFTGLAGGTFNIRVRNADDSCPVTYPTITLTAPTQPTITNVAVTNITNCGVTDGTINITAMGGSTSLEYSIDGGTTWQPSNIFIGLTAKSYTIAVRNVGGTCVTMGNAVIITAPVAPVITSVLSTDPSDCSINDGTITVNATGASLEYSINGGLTWQNSNVFTGLPSGNYFITVRNTSGTCAITYINNPVQLTAPAAPVITSANFTNPTNCGINDGTITVTAQGGVGTLQYSIDNGATWTQNGGTFTGLASGTYTVAIANADSSCKVSGQIINLDGPDAPIITNIVATNPTDCGNTDGTITVFVNSTNAVEYTIDGGANWVSSNIFIGLTGAGSPYTIGVRNVDGTCEVTQTGIIITDPVQPTITNVTST